MANRNGNAGSGNNTRGGFKKGFVAGVVAVGALIGGGLTWVASSYGEKVIDFAAEKVPGLSWLNQANAASANALASGIWYMAVDYKELGKGKDGKGDPVRIWVMKFKGDSNVTGSIASLDPKNTATGVSSGYIRDKTLTLAYASEDPSRPGYGSYMLARVDSSNAGQSAYYAGVAVVHSCLRGPDGDCGPGPRMECPAILSRQPMPAAELRAKHFTTKCRDLDIKWPDRQEVKK